MTTPILMLGAGRMGGAMVQGWLASGSFPASGLMICDPSPGDAARAAAEAGVRLNPPDETIAEAATVVLAVKPQVWREAATAFAPKLAWDAVVVSIAAGVALDDVASAFGGRTVARVMPTTAVAISRGTASVFARDPAARARAHALFAPLGAVVDIAEEELMHAATAVSGSAPAYLYAFIEALEAAGVSAGLTAEAASGLARSTITGAAALLAQGGEEPSELRRQVTSPGGVTLAALEVLMAEAGLPGLMREAARAAIRRSKELGG